MTLNNRRIEVSKEGFIFRAPVWDTKIMCFCVRKDGFVIGIGNKMSNGRMIMNDA
jgi:hypothetical protein